MKQDRTKQRNVAEFDALRALCGEQGNHNEKVALCRALGNYKFAEPDHQIAFESIRELFNRNALSKDALTVHLNNRGFPDIDLEKYFAPEAPRADECLTAMREFLP